LQRLPDNSYRFSPKDLIAYLEGDFAAWCERNHAERSRGNGTGIGGSTNGHYTPDVPDEEMELVFRRGLEHEAAHLARLRLLHPDLVEIERGDGAFDATWRAMQLGAPVIFQGELRADPWMGIADFLHRMDGPCTLGTHFYEPWDTKLSRSAKPYFLLQLCAYAEMLEAMQGHRPEKFGFVFGDGTETSFRTDDVWHYYRRLKRSFEQFQRDWTDGVQPDPGLDRTHGRWSECAEKLLDERDDLSLVAGITRSQIVRLREAGIDTLALLATTHAAAVPRMTAATFGTLREQAKMQLATRASGTIRWAFRAADAERPRRGLALLPPASAKDVFFDIEGFPFAPNGGLDYLLGVVTVDEGAPRFRDWWAHDEVEEKRAFEQFIDWAYARWQADPTLHIYHYASYERTALTRVSGKYATREREVDQFLIHDVLVDLYPVVHQGTVIGVPSYSLKQVERLYMPRRTGDVKSAGGSVVQYQHWLDRRESPDPAVSPILGGIRDYNRVDCESTVGLRDWLLVRQPEAGLEWVRPAASGIDTEEPAVASPAEELAGRLLERAEGLEEGSEVRRITSLLAWLLEFHRREEKPWWWRYFERMDYTDEQLHEDADCLAGLVRTATPLRAIKRSMGYEYRFDPAQESKLRDGDACAIVGTEDEKCVLERFVDRDAGLVELRVGPGRTLPDRLSIIPASLISTTTLRDSILRYVLQWAECAACTPALSDLLGRRPPRLTGEASTLAIDEAGDLTAQAIDAVRRLDRSTLCIQGPPGTGKTTAAAEMILALIADGKRVGIVANSHQVILNLLAKVASRGDELGVQPALVKSGGESDHPLIVDGRLKQIDSKAAAAAIAAGPLAIGGTAWLFSRPELAGTLDHLFIEEAGQFSLANAVAVGASAANLILLGDQIQLAQPTQGSHPGESGLSALEYLLEGHATVPPGRGIFLGRSYRMHPDVCRIISEAYYDGRLASAPSTASNRIVGGKATSVGLEAGVRFMPVEHLGCTQDSDEEVCAIETLVAELLACSVVVKGAALRPMVLDDILIVAPFNMQVRAIKQRLGASARVGSVDRFQGQEAPVVIVSMCASSLDDAPRGAGFLLSRNRLNVAVSRAQALAVVVGSERLGDVRVRSVEEMRLVSGWCRIEGFAQFGPG
jgi:predicted RecB family nuclease